MGITDSFRSWFKKNRQVPTPAPTPVEEQTDNTGMWLWPTPPKAVTASAGQIDRLATFLEERSRLHAQGALYRVDGISPKSGRAAYVVDNALMMLALSQCLVDS